MKPNGIELKLGSFKGGLWYDDQDQFYNKPGWGIKIALRWGPWICPIPKLWKKATWKNRWVDENILYTFRGQFILFPFISVALGNRGIYVGAKDNGWNLNNVLILSFAIHHKRN